uniref:Uncharacterized protein n=1 Tax=Candidatus Methanogaster sp. ANME-2c ERB4 TaxID=2759911 RepID=A0A7G9YDY4_9EURY|nr:hypothetical protein ABPEKODN_00031 [Methanosarcinales archaeon ANME-2c ERB4]
MAALTTTHEAMWSIWYASVSLLAYHYELIKAHSKMNNMKPLYSDSVLEVWGLVT